MSKFISFPHINQFSNVIKELKHNLMFEGIDGEGQPIYDVNKVLPIVTFHGTVKLHGSNGGIVSQGDEIWFQSRKNIVTPEKDNAGFSTHFSGTDKLEKIKDIIKSVRNDNNIPDDKILALFGEWAGGSIQKGVALNQLSKRFVIFGIRTFEFLDEDEGQDIYEWFPIRGYKDHSIDIYNIEDYKTYTVDLDVNNPMEAKEIIERYTLDVEKECPFSYAFGVSGLGEGIVWYSDVCNERRFFKSKGEKHQSVNRKKKSSAPLDIEKVNSIKEFVSYAVTVNRLEQGIEQVFTSTGTDLDRKHTGAYIKWISSDIAREEIDVLSENGLTMKDVGNQLSKTARDFLFDYIDKYDL